MRLGNVLHLYRIRLRRRLVQELLALSGIAVGVALVFASLVANSSMAVSMAELNRGVVGDMDVQLAARGGAGMDEDLLAAVLALPEVAAAAPILETRAVVVGPAGREGVELIGGDPHFAREGGPLLRTFTSDRLAAEEGIGLPASIARRVGATLAGPIEVITSRGLLPTRLGARLEEDDIGGLAHSPIAIAPLPYVQRLTGMEGQISRIYARAIPGRQRELRAELERLAAGRLDVRAADAEVDAFHRAATPTRQSTALFSVLAALVGFLFALAAVLLTVPQRRRFIADLRIAGYTPGAVVQVMLADALALGIAGLAVGLLLGDLLSRQLFDSVPGYLAFAFPVGAARTVTWSSVAIAATAGILSGCVAVLTPVREIFSRRALGGGPTDARGPSRRTIRYATAVGAGCLAIVALILVAAPAAAITGTLLLVAAMLLLLPVLVAGAVAIVGWLCQWVRSAVPAIALMELRSRAARTRTLALAATAAVAVFGIVAIGGAHADLERGLNASATEIDANADLWVSFPGAQNAFATTPVALSDRTVSAVRAIDGVASVARYRGAFLDIGDRRLWVLAPPPTADHAIPPRQILRGAEDVRGRGWIALSEALADELDVRVGDRVRLDAPRPVTLTVRTITTNLGWPPGALVISADDFARAWGSALPTALHVGLDGTRPASAVSADLERTLAPRGELLVETSSERQRRHHAVTDDALSRLTQISALVVGAAVLAMVTAMAGALWQRRAMFAGLKVDGFTEWELWRAVLLDSAVLLSSACLIGAAFGLAGQALMSRALAEVTGFPVFYEPGVGLSSAVLGGVTLLTLVFLAAPGLAAVRVRPAPGLST